MDNIQETIDSEVYKYLSNENINDLKRIKIRNEYLSFRNDIHRYLLKNKIEILLNQAVAENTPFIYQHSPTTIYEILYHYGGRYFAIIKDIHDFTKEVFLNNLKPKDCPELNPIVIKMLLKKIYISGHIRDGCLFKVWYNLYKLIFSLESDAKIRVLNLFEIRHGKYAKIKENENIYDFPKTYNSYGIVELETEEIESEFIEDNESLCSSSSYNESLGDMSDASTPISVQPKSKRKTFYKI